MTSLSGKAVFNNLPYIKLDKLDITILRELSQAQAMLPARIGLKSSYREMARKVGASAGTIRNRVEKMYSAGILSGSSVFVNPTIARMKGGAYALDVSPTIPKTQALARLKTLEKILFIHNFRGSMVGISFLFEDDQALKELEYQFHAMCGTDRGLFSYIEYPPCSLSFAERDWKLVFLLSEEGFLSYSQLARGLKVSVRTGVRQLSILRSAGAILSVPTLDYRAIRGGVAEDVIVAFTGPEAKEAAEKKILSLVQDYLILAGIGREYVVYNLILPSVAIATELASTISGIEGVTTVRAELVDEHIDLTRNLMGYVKNKMMLSKPVSSTRHHPNVAMAQKV